MNDLRKGRNSRESLAPRRCVLKTFGNPGFPLAAVCGDQSLIELHRQRMRYFVPGPHNPISRFRQGERLIHISDAAASEAYRDDPGWRELVDTGTCRSVLHNGGVRPVA